MDPQTGLTEGQAAGLGLLIILFFSIPGILLGCYVISRVGRKFGIGSFGEYCIPFYNLVLLCRCAGLSGWVAAGVSSAVLFVVFWPLGLFGLGCSVYLWGTIAQRLGKSFWPWGLGVHLGLPVLWLAFDSSMPVGAVAGRVEEEQTYDPVYQQESLIVRCIVGEYAGETFEIPNGGIVIGRDPAQSQLVLDSMEVSGKHARIEVDPSDEGTVVVTDLASSNGTFVLMPNTGGPSRWEAVRGNSRLPRREPHRIRIGNGIAEFEVGSRA